MIIPAFIAGKFTSDTIAVLMGEYAAANASAFLAGAISWKSVTGVLLGLLLITAFLFIDWRSFLQDKKLKINFKIWR